MVGDRSNLRFRRARADDLERLVEIHLASYPDRLSVGARERNFTQNPFGDLDDLVVAEDGGAVVAHAFLFPLRASFGGVAVKVGGIASVGVAPEARGRGVATTMMHHLHGLSDRRGDALTMLYAFRHGFYGRLGYATTSSRKRLAIDPRSIPASWRALARDRVRGLVPGDGRLLPRLHASAAKRSSGWITRSKRLWEMLVARETRITLVCAPARARKAGYVAFTLVQEELHGETRLEVDELIAEDDETRRALFGALAAMRDQVSEIVVEVGETDPLERALLDCDGRRFGSDAVEHGLGEIVGGPMVRIGDVPRALAARGYTGSGTFDVVVRSEEGAPTPQTIMARVRVRDGRAEVAPTPRGRGRRGSRALETTRAGLSAVFYGGLSATDAVALGLAEADPGVARVVDAVAKIPPLTPLDTF